MEVSRLREDTGFQARFDIELGAWDKELSGMEGDLQLSGGGAGILSVLWDSSPGGHPVGHPPRRPEPQLAGNSICL